MKAVLYGSQTSPYVRLARLVMVRAGAGSHVRFELADPFNAPHRKTNPLGRVPALVLEGGPALLETTLIVRALMEIGGTDLLPKDKSARLEAEADIALATGILDLGVAYVMESRRDGDDQSASWQQRRLDGIAASLPLLNDAARRASTDPGGAAALAIVVTADWLSFRLADVIDWQSVCPDVAALARIVLAEEDAAATDPRLASAT